MDKNSANFAIFKDIVGRIPYGAYFKVKGRPDIAWMMVSTITDDGIINKGLEESFTIDEIIPLLRPFSGMRGDEIHRLVEEMDKEPRTALIDFYNAYSIDYRELITQGLAEKMPEDLKKRVVPEVSPVGDA